MEVPVHQSSPPIDDEVHWIYDKNRGCVRFCYFEKRSAEIRKQKQGMNFLTIM